MGMIFELLFCVAGINIFNLLSLPGVSFFIFFAVWFFVYEMLTREIIYPVIVLFLSLGFNIVFHINSGNYEIILLTSFILLVQFFSALYFSENIKKMILPEKYLINYFAVIFILFSLFSVYTAGITGDYEFLLFPREIDSRVLALDGVNGSSVEIFFRVVGIIRPLTFSILLLVLFFSLFLSFFTAQTIFYSKRIYLAGIDKTGLKSRRPSEYLLLVLIASLLAVIFGKRYNNAFNVTGKNLLLLLSVVYFANGIMIFENFSAVFNLPKVLKIIFYFFSIIQVYMLGLLGVLGILDIWVDFRRLLLKYSYKKLTG